MRESEYILRSCLLAQTLGTFLDDTIHAPDGRNDPHLVADTDLSVLAAVAHEGTFLIGDVEHHVFRMILIAEQSSKVGLDIVLIHPAAGFLRLARMADRKTVFDNILAFG